MKQTIKTSRSAGYLEKIVRALNERYFNGELQEPMVTIQNTPKAYGHVTVAKTWHRADGTQQRELNIGAGTLDRPIEEVVATVQHELVHLYDLQRGIQDCSRGGRYHNKHFRDEATARDLKISYAPHVGWSITEPTDALIDFIISQGWTDIQMGRDGGGISQRTGGGNGSNAGTADGSGKKPSSTRKLICPNCGQTARVTKASAFIVCGFCNEPMVQA